MNKVENLNKKEISLQYLLPNDFYICEGKMVCNISLEKVNAISEIITNLQQENQQLKHILDELEKWLNCFHEYSEFGIWEIKKKLKELRGRENE